MITETQKIAFNKVIDTLAGAGVLGDIIVIGSWAEYIYENCNILQYSPMIRTQDLDILIKNLRKPKVELNIAFKNNGFVSYKDVSGLVKYSYNEDLEVEFLINELGAGRLEPYKTAMNVTAQGLRHLDVLLKNQISVEYNGHTVNVPHPAAYLLHKLVINNKRLPDYKKVKDAENVANMFDYMINDDNLLSTFMEIYNNQLTVKERKLVVETCDKHSQLYMVKRLILM